MVIFSTLPFLLHYLDSLQRYHVECSSPKLLLFTLIEFISSTSYNCILHNEPVSMEEYMPYMHAALRQICKVIEAALMPIGLYMGSRLLMYQQTKSEGFFPKERRKKTIAKIVIPTILLILGGLFFLGIGMM